MLDILHFLPAKRKTSSSGWISFNAPCCVHNSENQDRRSRGGLKLANEGWSFHCFNCGYTASFVLGRNLSYKARKLLSWLNVPQEEIERINLESLRHKSIAGLLNERQHLSTESQNIQFEERKLPDDLTPAWQLDYSKNYLTKRGLKDDYPLFHRKGTRPGIVIPFTYNNQIVGSSIRFLDNKIPKYINDMQPGYVFGTDLQRDSWQSVLVMEGVFDALSIGGVAVLHAEINDAQARLIRSLGREVVVVPDQDAAGMKLVDRAVELGWSVSMPDWGDDVKDVNDAVIKYGKLGALLIIMQAREHSKIKIELRKKNLLRKIS
jgi:DNA primase